MKRDIFYRAAAILCMMTLLAGCGTQLKGYSGAKLPVEQVAIVKTEKDVAIGHINGKEVFVTARNFLIPPVAPGLGKKTAALSPGEHVLRVSYIVPGWEGGPCWFKATVEAGKEYLLTQTTYDVNAVEEGSFLVFRGTEAKRIKIWLQDKTTQEDVSVEKTCYGEKG